MQAAQAKPLRASKARAFWLRQLHTWHWISAALSLAGMLLFALTGLTLNNARLFATPPVTHSQQAQLPAPLLHALAELPEEGEMLISGELPRWVRKTWSLQIARRPAELSADEIYIALPGPGTDAWLAIDRQSGSVEYQKTSRGTIAWLNDLHKGRNTGSVWTWFIDVFALGCIVFTLTGLALLWMHGKGRPATWPLTWLGLLLPVLVALLLIH